MLALPIDVGWLRSDLVGRLFEELGPAPGMKAIMLGGRLAPGHPVAETQEAASAPPGRY
ncbi:hypothetical protein [Kitasatospora camelliae]|uniref:Uncharacterized protein n=1 Tax=Kitasatospora camelliae TaxID=3156397 RepID=A0AAU8JRL8_9ACTN